MRLILLAVTVFSGFGSVAMLDGAEAGAPGKAGQRQEGPAAASATPGGAQTNAAPAGDNWMNFGIDDSIVEDAPKKKKITLKGQYFRVDVGFGETMPIEFKPENGIYVVDTKEDRKPEDNPGRDKLAFIPNSSMGNTRPELNTESGIRVSAVAGYNFNEYAGVELELSAQYARLGTIDVPSSGHTGEDNRGDKTDVKGGGQSYEVGGSVWQVPVFANFVLQYPNSLNITPFAGVGAGLVFMYTTIESDSTPLFGLVEGAAQTPTAQGDRASGTVVVPGWQGFGGLRWEITKDIGIHGMYRYTATSDFSYNGELDGIEFDGAQTHVYSGGVTFRY